MSVRSQYDLGVTWRTNDRLRPAVQRVEPAELDVVPDNDDELTGADLSLVRLRLSAQVKGKNPTSKKADDWKIVLILVLVSIRIIVRKRCGQKAYIQDSRQGRAPRNGDPLLERTGIRHAEVFPEPPNRRNAVGLRRPLHQARRGACRVAGVGTIGSPCITLESRVASVAIPFTCHVVMDHIGRIYTKEEPVVLALLICGPLLETIRVWCAEDCRPEFERHRNWGQTDRLALRHLGAVRPRAPQV